MEILIDTRALKENVLLVKQKTGKKILLPVKANAYGHGLKKTVQNSFDIVDGFWTATAEEAIAVKKLTDKKTVLSVFESKDVKSLLFAGVEICVNSKEEYCFLTRKALQLGVCARVHICIDTSMKRFGFSESSDFSFLKEKNSSLKVCGVYTHLAKNDLNFIEETEEKFFKSFDNIKRFFGDIPQTHLFASPSVETLLSFPRPIAGDYIRTGLLCYGITNVDIPVKPVMRVYTRIIAVNKVKKGDGVGYGNKFVCEADGYVFTMEGGYFDGIFHSFAGGFVEIEKKWCKIVAVCMDCFMAFTSEFRPEKGKPVAVMNERISASLIAKEQNRIPYDVVTSFQGRNKRKYL